MEMQFKNEIKKLADVVVWADNWINNMKEGLTEEEFAEDEEVRAFETVKKVVLESMERHAVYTTSLNKDIADKAAKIDLLEKEIEGRKEGYIALKVRMDTKCISIEEHNNICEDFKKKIVKLEKESEKWQDLANMNRDTICNQYDVCEEFKNKIAELEKELADRNVKIRHQKENLDGINKTLEIRTKENESLIAVRNNLNKEIEAHESENARLTEKIIELKKENAYLKKELNETCTCKELDLKGHNRREMALVNDLADKNDEIKSLKEENSYLKSEIKQKQNIIKKAYDRYSDEIIKTRKDLMEVAYRDIEKDNGYVGFKLYVKSALREAKGNKEEANEVITEAVRFFYREWDKEQKEKEEETKVKGVGRTSSGRYPWGAKVNDIPCGEDAIE